jgi:hypothetical protein
MRTRWQLSNRTNIYPMKIFAHGPAGVGVQYLS